MSFHRMEHSPDSRRSGLLATAIDHRAHHASLRQELVRSLYMVAGVALFFVGWWLAASQLPRSRLVTPLEGAQDIWTNFFYSPRLGVFGLGNVGYGSLLLYTISNVVIGLIVGGTIGTLIGI